MKDLICGVYTGKDIFDVIQLNDEIRVELFDPSFPDDSFYIIEPVNAIEIQSNCKNDNRIFIITLTNYTIHYNEEYKEDIKFIHKPGRWLRPANILDVELIKVKK